MKPYPKQKPIHFYTYRGKQRSLTSLSKERGVPLNTLRSRLCKGMSIEKAVEMPVSKTPKYTYKNKEYTLLQLSKQAGVSKTTVSNRLKRGWSVEQAVEAKTKSTQSEYPTVYNLNKPLKNKAPTLFATCSGRCNAK